MCPIHELEREGEREREREREGGGRERIRCLLTAIVHAYIHVKAFNLWSKVAVVIT